MTDEYLHGKVQEALERQAEVRELERMYRGPAKMIRSTDAACNELREKEIDHEPDSVKAGYSPSHEAGLEDKRTEEK